MWRPARRRVPASGVRGWFLCVAGDQPCPVGVGDAGPRSPGCEEAAGRLARGVGLGFPWACGMLTSLQPLEESQREGRAGWQKYLAVHLFFFF